MAKILIVEDDEDTSEVISDLLTATGHNCICVDDGSKAMESAIQFQPDLILMDINLPFLNGMEATRQLQRIEKTRHIPIIIVSGYARETDRITSIEAGAILFLAKPFSPDELIARIQDVIDRVTELAQKLGLTEIEANQEFMRRFRLQQHNIKKWVTNFNKFTTKQTIHRIATKAPKLHSQLCEAEVITGGIIHDLRNIIGVAEANLWKLPRPTDNHEQPTKITRDLKRLRYLIEDLGELRYTSYWSPRREQQNTILQAIHWVRDYYPEFTIEIAENPSERDLYCEKRQIQQSFLNLTDLLVAISANQQVTIKRANDGEWVIEAKLDANADWNTIHNPEHCARGNLNAIRHFIAQRLVARQGGSLISEVKSDQLTLRLSLPTNTPPDPLDETVLAKLNAQIAAVPTHSTEPTPQTASNLHFLFVPVCVQVFTLIDRIERNLHELVFEKKEDKVVLNIGHSLRFARLLVRNLLITVAGYEPQLKPLNLKPLVEMVINLLKSKLLQTVQVQIPDQLPMIVADELGVMQIVLNLLTNAGEATDEEGEIIVRAGYVDGNVKLEIEDTGQGISGEVLKRIFELDYSTKSGHQRGVGLYVVKSIADRLGARIEVSSKVNTGTKFLILFPTQQTG